MAIYYAIVRTRAGGEHVQRNVTSGQLEIYEERKMALAECPSSCEVLRVSVTKALVSG